MHGTRRRRNQGLATVLWVASKASRLSELWGKICVRPLGFRAILVAQFMVPKIPSVP